MTIDTDDVVLLALGVVVATLPLAWFTHLVWIISVLASSAGATAGQIVLGLIGLLIFPIGILHGYMIWFGVGT